LLDSGKICWRFVVCVALMTALEVLARFPTNADSSAFTV
jgi:hypothetical protein